jgi:hypothetical protein
VYSVIFTQAARAELIDAQIWYEDEAGSGWHFRHAIGALIERMRDNPRQFPAVYKNVRRALLRRFPYSLFLVLEADAPIVIAHSLRGDAIRIISMRKANRREQKIYKKRLGAA